MTEPTVRLVPWSADDLPLLRRINTPEMRAHVGGTESEEQVLARHLRYLALENGCMFRVELPGGEPAGSVAFWSRVWHDEPVYESGWGVLPEFQGRGIASAAVRAVLAAARADGRHRWLHAFPSVANAASNAVCRKTGFTLVGETEFEYPPGRFMRSNDWRYDLSA
ncbi:GNAT family N-acetyltransferase [Asanoa sp. NPDC049518]|uniref:GNAT family N-acetyltransferase n=1 Tax=unclassified Asanoa TaxID=2685164 RepID=UPI00341A20B8